MNIRPITVKLNVTSKMLQQTTQNEVNSKKSGNSPETVIERYTVFPKKHQLLFSCITNQIKSNLIVSVACIARLQSSDD